MPKSLNDKSYGRQQEATGVTRDIRECTGIKVHSRNDNVTTELVITLPFRASRENVQQVLAVLRITGYAVTRTYNDSREIRVAAKGW